MTSLWHGEILRDSRTKRHQLLARSLQTIQLFWEEKISFLQLCNPKIIDHHQSSFLEGAWKRFQTSSREVELKLHLQNLISFMVLLWNWDINPMRSKNTKASTTPQVSLRTPLTILRGKHQLSATLSSAAKSHRSWARIALYKGAWKNSEVQKP